MGRVAIEVLAEADPVEVDLAAVDLVEADLGLAEVALAAGMVFVAAFLVLVLAIWAAAPGIDPVDPERSVDQN